jgi:hypothetical protein
MHHSSLHSCIFPKIVPVAKSVRPTFCCGDSAIATIASFLSASAQRPAQAKSFHGPRTFPAIRITQSHTPRRNPACAAAINDVAADETGAIDQWIEDQIGAVEANPLDDGFFERAAGNGLKAIATAPLSARRAEAWEMAFLSRLTQVRLAALAVIDTERAYRTLDIYGDFLAGSVRDEVARLIDLAHRLARASALSAAVLACPDRRKWRHVGQAAAQYEFPDDDAFRELLGGLIASATAKKRQSRRHHVASAQNRLLDAALPAADRPAATGVSQLIGRSPEGRSDWSVLPPLARQGLTALLDRQAQGRIPVEDARARQIYCLANGMSIAAPHRFRLVSLAAAPFNRLPPPWRRHLIHVQTELWRPDFAPLHMPNAALIRHAARTLAPRLTHHGLAVDL